MSINNLEQALEMRDKEYKIALVRAYAAMFILGSAVGYLVAWVQFA